MLFLVAGVTMSFAQTTVKGVVKENNNGQELPLPFANVFIEGTTLGAQSDFDGNYFITISDPGTYNISFSFVGLQKVTKQIEVTGEGEIVVNVTLAADDKTLAEVKVTGTANRENETVLMLEQKKATVIKESIGAKRLSNLGVSNAAGATSKITGVTKNEGSGDIYIRGLGDRYLFTTMNGLPIPSDDVAKKNIDLGLFSTNVIKNVSISKTSNVAKYADVTSGHVDISSKTMSRKITLGLSSGSNSNVLSGGVFNDFQVTQNYGNSTMGFYQKPYELRDAITKQSWSTSSRKTPIDYSFSLFGGKKIMINDNPLNVFSTISHNGSSEFREGTFQKYRANILDQSYTDVTNFYTTITSTGLVNLSYDFSPKHKLSFNSLYVHKTIDRLFEAGRNLEGYVFDQDPKEFEAFVRDQNLKQTQLITNQLLGTHTFTDKNELKWAAGLNNVNAGEPNRIRNEGNTYVNQGFEFAGVSDMSQRKSFQKIADTEVSGYIEDKIKFIDEGENLLNLNVGANVRYKQRDFASHAIGVRAKGTRVSSFDNINEALLNDALYSNGSLRIKTPLEDTYEATLLIYSGYASADFKKNKISGNAGVRYEQDEIDVDFDVANYINPETYQSRIGTSSKSYTNILPSLNLKYELTDISSLRFAFSKTVTLPEFKEIAPFEYVSPEGRVIKGNPDLIRSQNYNFDLKWEMFPQGGNLFSATGFYKQINDPINVAMERGSSGYFFFANTGEQANVYGFELETRYDIIKAESTTSPELNLTFNATKMWFNQDLYEDFKYNNKTESALQGAADLILNAALTFSNNKRKAFSATVSGNYSSDKILALGAPEDKANSETLFNNEIIEKGFVTLDVILSKKLSDRVSLRLTGKNLLNPKIKQTQFIEPQSGNGKNRDAVVLSYKKGMAVKLGVNINLN